MQRHGYGGTAALRHRYRVAGCVLLAAHLVVVGWLAMRPLTAPWVSAAHLEPFATLRADLALGPWDATREIFRGLLPFAPLGVLLPWAGGRLDASRLGSLARTVFTSAMLSLVLQVVRGGVVGQVLDLDALLLNVTGVTVAHLAVVPAARARLRRRDQGDEGVRAASSRPPLPLLREEGSSQGSTPTIPRVGVAPWSDALPGARP
ncbi:VanZ family protein [Streptomyces huiliensis]|uniref:VanZ family protein n=1 Tax=Streptomyces huiliensis TaxID=2876027 RepID=UPI001CBAAB3C|nr:VanZ family protein [Streptomyces huiliensis]MBZ4320558.1 VanZ family protein [Streptomyces huiliensis]